MAVEMRELENVGLHFDAFRREGLLVMLCWFWSRLTLDGSKCVYREDDISQMNYELKEKERIERVD